MFFHVSDCLLGGVVPSSQPLNWKRIALVLSLVVFDGSRCECFMDRTRLQEKYSVELRQTT